MIRYFCLFAAGAVLGSFVECLASRFADPSLKGLRSVCEHCGYVLGAKDLVPVFSFLFCKGRCRYCGKKIPLACWSMEMAGGTLACLAAGKTQDLLEGILIGAVLVTMVFLMRADRKTMCVPAAGMAAFLASAAALGMYRKINAAEFLASTAYGWGMIAFCFLEKILRRKESVGLGDGLFLLGAGVFLGSERMIPAVLAGSLIGLAESVLRHRRVLPFLPALGTGILIAWLWKG